MLTKQTRRIEAVFTNVYSVTIIHLHIRMDSQGLFEWWTPTQLELSSCQNAGCTRRRCLREERNAQKMRMTKEWFGSRTTPAQPRSRSSTIKLRPTRILERQAKAISRKKLPDIINAGSLAYCHSPWSATQFIPKKDSEADARMVHDFRPINQVTSKDSYSILEKPQDQQVQLRQHEEF